MSHDSRETLGHLTTVVRHLRDCLTTVRASHERREIFARVSHDIRVNFNQFYFLAINLEVVLFMSQSFRICIAHLSQVQITEIKLRCVYERLRRVGDGFATHATTWRLFCNDFCRTKKYSIFKTFADCSRPFDQFAMYAMTTKLRCHANVWRRFRD